MTPAPNGDSAVATPGGDDLRYPPEPTKVLRLTIEVPGMWADDLDECAGYIVEATDCTPEQARLDVVVEEWMRENVGLTIVTIPGPKCGNDDFEVHAFTGRIVAAEAVDR